MTVCQEVAVIIIVILILSRILAHIAASNDDIKAYPVWPSNLHEAVNGQKKNKKIYALSCCVEITLDEVVRQVC